MKLVTTGDIYRLFKEADENTVIRKSNIRKFILDNKLFCTKRKTWIIKLDEFMENINPKNMQKHCTTIPIIRTLKDCRIMFNQKFNLNLSHHDTENLVPNKAFFCYKYGNRWLINYNEFETYLLKKFKITRNNKLSK